MSNPEEAVTEREANRTRREPVQTRADRDEARSERDQERRVSGETFLNSAASRNERNEATCEKEPSQPSELTDDEKTERLRRLSEKLDRAIRDLGEHEEDIMERSREYAAFAERIAKQRKEFANMLDPPRNERDDAAKNSERMDVAETERSSELRENLARPLRELGELEEHMLAKCHETAVVAARIGKLRDACMIEQELLRQNAATLEQLEEFRLTIYYGFEAAFEGPFD